MPKAGSDVCEPVETGKVNTNEERVVGIQFGTPSFDGLGRASASGEGHRSSGWCGTSNCFPFGNSRTRVGAPEG